ncbi:hypothetical protein ACP4QI_010225 [Leclercia sp. TB492]|uniref:hypothetical protein n=1 Tax=Leclercia sp. TB492 TaxID=3412682 RepID=UPI003CF67C8E
MINVITTAALMVAFSLTGCTAPQKDTPISQLNQFREIRTLYNSAYLRCHEKVREKYYSRLVGEKLVEGAEREAVSHAYYTERRVCTDNYNRKMQSLVDAQSPEVKAYFEQRQTEQHNQIIAIEKEANR